MQIRQISFHAKQRFAERYFPEALQTINKMVLHQRLSGKEVNQLRNLERQMLEIVNYKIAPIFRNKQHVQVVAAEYKDLSFIIRFEGHEGKIITVRWTSDLR